MHSQLHKQTKMFNQIEDCLIQLAIENPIDYYVKAQNQSLNVNAKQSQSACQQVASISLHPGWSLDNP